MITTWCPAYEIDAKNDMRIVQEKTQEKIIISGNIDPALVSEQTPEKIISAVRDVISLYRGKGGLILCSGCALSPFTPEENMQAFAQTVIKEG